MIYGVLAVLVVLWLLGIVQIPYLDYVLFSVNGQGIEIKELLIFLAIVWLIGLLKSPFREVVTVLFLIWILSLLGIVAVTGLSDFIVLAVVIGVIASLFRK
ncbi:MAG: hypothetical protein N2691_05195 [Patescibacteria group bacterium]|nr:hypothetical protein [Patescibacteria group bacterium]